MTEKRYYIHKHLLKENGVHDKICHRFMSIDETVEHLNNEYWKYKQLKKENDELKASNEGLLKDLNYGCKLIKSVEKENDLLKEKNILLISEKDCYKSRYKNQFKANDQMIKVLYSFYERDLLDIERILLDNICKEIGVMTYDK